MVERKLRRINFNLDEELVARSDEEAARLHIARSSLLAIIITEYFQALDNKRNLDYLANLFRESGLDSTVFKDMARIVGTVPPDSES